MTAVTREEWARRADLAARSVTGGFGGRLLGLPWTHLGAVRRPAGSPALLQPWHYWWQAHYVDCLVDTGRRELAAGRRFAGPHRPSAGRMASRLVRGIRIRNAGRFTNLYYDDMAWLALAVQRLDGLAADAHRGGRRRNRRALAALARRLESAHTPELGGGLYWNTERNFKNTPATAPAALFFARAGDSRQARQLVDWLAANLFDPGTGLYRDGLRIVGGRPVPVPDLYTYNQGPVLGALLELARDGTPAAAASAEHAAGLVAAVARGLTAPAGSPAPGALITHGGGDGGLFTGILARYLALAANSPLLPASARTQARTVITTTAAALWAGRSPWAAGAGGTRDLTVFPTAPGSAAEPGAAVDLSTQLQAWMILEAAAACIE
jgi:predicted alpha-1,6-mannanase (GH76 family)